jgi:hypothetical protein
MVPYTMSVGRPDGCGAPLGWVRSRNRGRWIVGILYMPVPGDRVTALCVLQIPPRPWCSAGPASGFAGNCCVWRQSFMATRADARLAAAEVSESFTDRVRAGPGLEGISLIINTLQFWHGCCLPTGGHRKMIRGGCESIGDGERGGSSEDWTA